MLLSESLPVWAWMLLPESYSVSWLFYLICFIDSPKLFSFPHDARKAWFLEQVWSGSSQMWSGFSLGGVGVYSPHSWQTPAEEDLEEQLSRCSQEPLWVPVRGTIHDWWDPLALQWESKEEIEALISVSGPGMASLNKRRKVLRNCVESGTWKEKDPGCRQSPDNYIGQVSSARLENIRV